jgi:phosphoribosylamine---glycine ligase
MKILIIGSGGREHALAWKISQSPEVEKIYCIPGNPGIAGIASCTDIPISDFPSIAKFVRDEKIDLTVVGPEVPLVDGIADYFNKEGLKIFGPRKEAARLEGSKIFAKELMRKYNVPTAQFEIFSSSEKAIKYINERGAPIVVKADGLAAGKGVIVAKTTEEAADAVKKILEEKIFKESGNKIIIEDCLKGEEVSILAFVDGITFIPLISSQDHKRIYDGDRGPNTGGMGAYAPAPLANKEIHEKINKEVFSRLTDGFRSEGIRYNGILYAGLMIDNGNISVLEFNVRFGDPETQAILPLLDTDLTKVLLACADNKLNEITLKWKQGSAICVVLASGGYPEAYENGREIKGLERTDSLEDITVFHAGTALKDGRIVTSGGRVLGIAAIGSEVKNAQSKAYEAIKNIHFDGMNYRKDIGNKALKY